MQSLRDRVARHSAPAEAWRSISRLRLIAIAAGLLATVTSTLSVYPHQLAYFNEAAGGPENGHKHLLHSNLDWGQDLLYVQDYLRARGVAFNIIDFSDYQSLPRIRLGQVGEHPPSDDTWVVAGARVVTREMQDVLSAPAPGWEVSRVNYATWVFCYSPHERSTTRR